MSATPGPWKVDEMTVYAVRTLHIYGSGRLIARMAYRDDGDPEVDDNAALIAAAPELLQRLKESRDAIASLPNDALGSVTDSDESGWYIKDELLHYIDVTIAKAEPAQ